MLQVLDGISRVVRLKTASGILDRPIQRIYPLEVFGDTNELKKMASGLHDKSIEQLMDIPSSSEDEEEGSESEEYYNASKLLFTSTKQNPPIDEDNNLPDLERPPTSNTVSVPVPENDIVLNEDDIDHNKSLLWQIFICHKP
ncbi:hypothetical protein J6590_025494 [Homalodisca vitripennis]|nr:hypothetical protein J6590_025494 [Homalodisca vitripennis]